MSSKPVALFIDDEKFFATRYAEELSKHFEVVFILDATKGVEAITQREEVSLVVLDVMMPPPDGLEAETEDGLSTGVWVMAQVRESVIARSLPVLSLTNRNLRDVRAGMDRLEFPEGLVIVRSKLETPAFSLPTIAKALVQQWQV